MPRKPKPDPNICKYCGGIHPLTEAQVEELRPRLLALFAQLGGSAEFQRQAYSAWVELLPLRFEHCEVTGPEWFVQQAIRDIEDFVSRHGTLPPRPAPGKPERVQ